MDHPQDQPSGHLLTFQWSQETKGAIPPAAPSPAVPESTSEVPRPPSSNEQPDNEPDVPSISSDSPISQPPVNSHVNPPPAHEVPLPDTSDEDDGLYVDDETCFNLQEDHCYSFAVDINKRDVDQWKEESRPEEMSFLVSAAKRQRSEVKISTLGPKERKLFEDAKSKEVDSWLATSTVCRILRNQVPTENILRCILLGKKVEANDALDASKSNSAVGAQQPRQKPKARLVVLGFEDPLVDQIPRDSPTMSKLSRVLILQHAASLGWDIHSFDIKTAFLRGTECSERI